MANTIYTFTKNGTRYSSGGNNRFEAQLFIELAHHVNLSGATFEEYYKLRLIRTGIVK